MSVRETFLDAEDLWPLRKELNKLRVELEFLEDDLENMAICESCDDWGCEECLEDEFYYLDSEGD